MTIGEKIRFFRTEKGITQTQLAELSEIHPVSIRKYETNKMQPQSTQIEKIATALGINAVVLTGTTKLKFETAEDIMSALLLLINSGIMQVYENDFIHGKSKSSTTFLKLNSIFSSYLTVTNKTDDLPINLEDVYFKVENQNIFKEFELMNINGESRVSKSEKEQVEFESKIIAKVIEDTENKVLNKEKSNL
ncbi:MAG: helix-turn-helix transcriptional regulator [Clostridia bacterium]